MIEPSYVLGLIGGLMIGTAAALYLLANGRIMGASGILGSVVDGSAGAGMGEKLLFLLDTGARFLILMDTPNVKKLNLPRGFDLALSGWGEDGNSQAYQTDITRIDLGGVYFDDMKAALIPVSQTHYYLREDEVPLS